MPCHTETIDTGPQFERMLCYVLTKMEAGWPMTKIVNGDPEVRSWWTNHKAEDIAREAQELADRRIAAAKESALAKLTPDERALLGFHK